MKAFVKLCDKSNISFWGEKPLLWMSPHTVKQESWRGQTMKELRIQELASDYKAMSPSSDTQQGPGPSVSYWTSLQLKSPSVVKTIIKYLPQGCCKD